MSDEKLINDESSANNDANYQPPVIEEVVSREGLEREAAYAGPTAGSPPP